jgi:hypothetical protein
MKSRNRQVEAVIAQFQIWGTIDRVRNLVAIYEVTLSTSRRGRKPIGSTDVLRAAVVLLHAGMEEFLRELIRFDWPHSTEEVLNQVPLRGQGWRTRPEKFFLGRLTAFRNETVESVINNSIREYLETTNFNNSTEIAATLKSLGIDPACAVKLYPAIDDLTARRHRIVHKGDKNSSQGKGQHSTSSLSVSKVNKWADSVNEFARLVTQQYILTIKNT